MLKFVEKRWDINFADEAQMIELLHIAFVKEPREEVPVISEDDIMRGTVETENGELSSATTDLQLDFWTAFVQYCAEHGRSEDIGSRKPFGQNWYDVTVGSPDYHLFFQLLKKKILRIGGYVYNPESFLKLESKKAKIEDAWVFPLSGTPAGKIV
jgi:hypothetical protein